MSRVRVRRVPHSVIVATIAIAMGLLAVLTAPDAAAHGMIQSSSPQAGAHLAQSPDIVSITFDDPVRLDDIGYLQVSDSHGERVDVGGTFHLDGDTATIASRLRPDLPDDVYTESYRIISADSHPVSGVIQFVVGAGAAGATASLDAVASAATAPSTGAAFAIARWTSFSGLALLGGIWLLFTVWPAGWRDRRARLIIGTAVTTLIAGALAELLLQGPYVAGSGLAGVGRLTLLRATLASDYGYLHLLRLVLLIGLALLLRAVADTDPIPAGDRARTRLPAWAHLGWPVALAVTLTFSMTGHPMTVGPQWLSVSVDLLHLVAMSAWIGGLVLLTVVVLPRHDAQVSRRSLPAVSRVSFGAVIVLALTGAYAAWRNIGPVDAIVGTGYGRLVVAKAALFAVLLGLGNLSRMVIARRVTRAPAGGELTGTETRRMRLSVLLEIGVAAIVLAASAALVNQPRGPEALASAHQLPVTASAALSTDAAGKQSAATITVDPGVHGPVTVTVDLPPDTPVAGLAATAIQQDRHIGPLPVPLRVEAGQARYSATVSLPTPGEWLITLTVTKSEFDAVTTDASITLY